MLKTLAPTQALTNNPTTNLRWATKATDIALTAEALLPTVVAMANLSRAITEAATGDLVDNDLLLSTCAKIWSCEVNNQTSLYVQNCLENLFTAKIDMNYK